MKIHSLKMTIMDVPGEGSEELFAAVFATVVVDHGETAKNTDGTDRLDEEGQVIPVLEDVQAVFPLNKDPVFMGNIQAILTEILTLKNWEIAKEEGQLSHFIQAVGANIEDGEGSAETNEPQDAETETDPKE